MKHHRMKWKVVLRGRGVATRSASACVRMHYYRSFSSRENIDGHTSTFWDWGTGNLESFARGHISYIFLVGLNLPLLWHPATTLLQMRDAK